jgi:hypothetical protein
MKVSDKLSNLMNDFFKQLAVVLEEEEDKPTLPVKDKFKATYKVAGVTHSNEVEITPQYSTMSLVTSEAYLQNLLVKSTEEIGKLEKSNLGMLNVPVTVTIERGDKVKNVGTIPIARTWSVAPSDFTKMNASLQSAYKGF